MPESLDANERKGGKGAQKQRDEHWLFLRPLLNFAFLCVKKQVYPAKRSTSMTADPLTHIRIILVDTLEPGNIGSAARAMKTMGLTRLALVRPAKFPHANASKMAVSAADVLAEASVHAQLANALEGCHAIYGVSARQRAIPLPATTPRECAPMAVAHARSAGVAFVFGGEEAGLSNDDLGLCSTLVQIPSDPACRSLNLAAAVQLVAYELRLASLGNTHLPSLPQRAPAESFERLLATLDTALADAGWYNNKNPALALEKLRRILHRAELSADDVKMLLGAVGRLARR